MANFATTCTLLLWACVLGAWAAALDVRASAHNMATRYNATVVKYDGPRYTLSAEENAKRLHAHATNGTWNAPDDMPRIYLEEGKILDMGASDGNSSLVKRSGEHYIVAYGGYGCVTGTGLAGVLNFGCGTGCVIIPPGSAYSGLVVQEFHANPYPTMDVWAGATCSGTTLQHFGVVDTESCTNVNNCCGFKSFIGYYGCSH